MVVVVVVMIMMMMMIMMIMMMMMIMLIKHDVSRDTSAAGVFGNEQGAATLRATAAPNNRTLNPLQLLPLTTEP